MYNLIKVIILGFLLLYPILIYFGLNYFSPSQLGLFFLALFAIRIIFTKTKTKTARWQMLFTVAIGGTLAVLTWIFNSKEYLLWYPVGLNIAFFLIFVASILYPPTVIEQLARVLNKDFSASGVRYTRNVTIIWSVFFIVNSAIAAWTVVNDDMKIWTLYNGLISYIIVGLIFAIEFLVRRFSSHK